MKKYIIILVIGFLTGYHAICYGQQKIGNGAKVLILGNSITHHGPDPAIGWSGNWGMAASSKQNDFVHLLEAKIQGENKDAVVQDENIADSFERKFWEFDQEQFKNYGKVKFDLIILKIGENVNDSVALEKSFDQAVEKLIGSLDPDHKAKICVVSSFWPRKHVDSLLQVVAERNKWLFVSLSGIYGSNSNNTAMRSYQNKGVGMHPSDEGMRKIADRIWEKIEYLFK